MEKKFQPDAHSFKNTFCVFNEMHIDSINGLKIQYHSKSGSKYYYTTLGMYRLSNHWGRLANSKWRLEPLEWQDGSKIKLGYAPWNTFYPDNALDKIYYLEVSISKKIVNYQHKNNPNFDNKAVVRTSFETTKRIKQVRNLLNLTAWAKYFDYDDIDLLRQKMIKELIFTNKTLEQIKLECSLL